MRSQRSPGKSRERNFAPALFQVGFGPEHLIAQITDLVFDLTLLHPEAGVQATGSIR